MEITNELKAKLQKRIGEQIERTFETVDLYNYFKNGYYQESKSAKIKDGERWIDDDIIADYVITNLSDAKTGYQMNVRVVEIRREGETNETSFDGFSFEYKTQNGRLVMPLKSILQNG